MPICPFTTSILRTYPRKILSFLVAYVWYLCPMSHILVAVDEILSPKTAR
jgi:hypothetical protein